MFFLLKIHHPITHSRSLLIGIDNNVVAVVVFGWYRSIHDVCISSSLKSFFTGCCEHRRLIELCPRSFLLFNGISMVMLNLKLDTENFFSVSIVRCERKLFMLLFFQMDWKFWIANYDNRTFLSLSLFRSGWKLNSTWRYDEFPASIVVITISNHFLR